MCWIWQEEVGQARRWQALERVETCMCLKSIEATNPRCTLEALASRPAYPHPINASRAHVF